MKNPKHKINNAYIIGLVSFFSLMIVSLITANSLNTKQPQTYQSKAASNRNIIGINIAGRQWEVKDAYNIVGGNGWIMVMSHPYDFPALTNELKKAPGANIILRPYTDPLGGSSDKEKQKATNRQFAREWADALTTFDTGGRTIYFMPWNEPNMPNECLGYGSNENTLCAEFVSEYIKDLKQFLQEKGLLGSKVKLISPMINQHNPNFYDFLNALGGAVNFYGQFRDSDGKMMVTMNLYDLEDQCPQNNSTPLCQTGANQARYNAGRYRELLNSLGIGDAKVFAAETGIVDKMCNSQGGPTDCPFLEDNRMYKLFQAVYPIWNSDPDFVMFSPLSYTPGYIGNEDSTPWIYESTLTKPYLISLRGGNPAAPTATQIPPVIPTNTIRPLPTNTPVSNPSPTNHPSLSITPSLSPASTPRVSPFPSAMLISTTPVPTHNSSIPTLPISPFIRTTSFPTINQPTGAIQVITPTSLPKKSNWDEVIIIVKKTFFNLFASLVKLNDLILP